MTRKTPKEVYDDNLIELIEKATDHDLHSDEATAAIKNLKTFSECHIAIEDTEPEPTTKWGKVSRNLGKAWDNESTRALLKAGGAFAGVVTVVYATIHKDHIVERQAIQQANQRSV